MNICDLISDKNQIKGIDLDFRTKVKNNWDSIAKPLDSLGRFENIHSQIGAICGLTNNIIKKSCILVFCSDNGVVEEGISQSTQEVTSICAESISRGKSCLANMAKNSNTDVIVIDVGINNDKSFEFVKNLKIKKGTNNFSKEPAMSKEDAIKALQTGFDLVKEYKDKGYNIIGIGEMGIGNTTTSSAVAAALLKIPAKDVTGRGAGLSDNGLLKKIAVIENAIVKYNLYELEPMTVIQKVGGFDIAAMTGACIGAAYYGVPLVLDGFISNVAALAAVRMIPNVKNYLIPSHKSKEPAAKIISDELGLHPVIDANMALGEGTGAALMISLLRTINDVYESSVSFEGISMEQYVRL